MFRQRADELPKALSDAYDFTGCARAVLRTDGCSDVDNDKGPSNFGQMLMLARPGQTWAVGTDFSVMDLPTDAPWAEGAGRDLARCDLRRRRVAAGARIRRPEQRSIPLTKSLAKSIAPPGAPSNAIRARNQGLASVLISVARQCRLQARAQRSGAE